MLVQGKVRGKNVTFDKALSMAILDIEDEDWLPEFIKDELRQIVRASDKRKYSNVAKLPKL